jgi:DNA-binding MarR family transcriptional regulator
MSSERESGFELPRFLPYRLDRLAERVSDALSALYRARFGLTVPEWRVLVWLDHAPSLTARDIAARAHMDKATVSRAVQRLAARELIARRIAVGDQRAQELTLTRKGRQLLTRLLPSVTDWESGLLAALGPGEQEQLNLLLGKLEAQLLRLEAADGSA